VVAQPVGGSVERDDDGAVEWAAAGISDSGISGFFYAARAGC
jgi:hypothetical protein